MCDPLTGIALAGSIGAAGINAMQQQNLLSSQNAANNAWVTYQTQQANQERAADAAMRQQATAAQQDTLQKLAPVLSATQLKKFQIIQQQMHAHMGHMAHGQTGTPTAPAQN